MTPDDETCHRRCTDDDHQEPVVAAAADDDDRRSGGAFCFDTIDNHRQSSTSTPTSDPDPDPSSDCVNGDASNSFEDDASRNRVTSTGRRFSTGDVIDIISTDAAAVSSAPAAPAAPAAAAAAASSAASTSSPSAARRGRGFVAVDSRPSSTFRRRAALLMRQCRHLATGLVLFTLASCASGRLSLLH